VVVVTEANLDEVLLEMIPEAAALYREKVEEDRSYMGDPESLPSAYTVLSEVFLHGTLGPSGTASSAASATEADLQGRCFAFIDLVLASPDKYVRDAAIIRIARKIGQYFEPEVLRGLAGQNLTQLLTTERPFDLGL